MSDDTRKDEDAKGADEEKPIADETSIRDAPKKPKKPKREKTGDGDGDKDEKQKQSDILFELALSCVDLFHSPDDTKYSTYADLNIDGRRETHVIESRKFKSWLNSLYQKRMHSTPGREVINTVVAALSARAETDAPQRTAHVRVARHDGDIYIDLGAPCWRAVRIWSGGWCVVSKPPVRFRRGSAMRQLPIPVAGGKIDDLRHFLNTRDDDSFTMVIAWLVAALRETGPYPVLVINGEAGAAKSTLTRFVRALVDPNTAPLRSMSRTDRDLFISATNSWVLAFDNCSGIQNWLSDCLCRLATGGGFATRQLFSDMDEVIFTAQRPIILNGITDLVDRGDLADRAVFVHLVHVPDEIRKAESDMWPEFEQALPKIFGALLDAVSTGLRELPNVKLATLPRMADFCKWAESCSGDFTTNEGDFIRAYERNRANAVASVVEADLVATALKDFADSLVEEKWVGSSMELLTKLEDIVGEKVTKNKDWPRSPRGLTAQVDRATTSLRKTGINVERLPRKGNVRPIWVWRAKPRASSD